MSDQPGTFQRVKDESMTLLKTVLDNPIDPGYAEIAHRKARGEDEPASPTRKIIVAVVAIALGFGLILAVVTLRQPEPAAVQARTTLLNEIERSNAHVDQLTASNSALQQEIDDLQTQTLGESDTQDQQTLAMISGAIPIHGTGVVVSLSDAPVGDDGLVPDNGFVRDSDLQMTVNGLFAAGAEAISINGHRLTSVTAIRNAGQAVLVDLQPISSPYIVRAIGDEASIQTNLAKSTAGRYLQQLKSNYDIAVDISAEKNVTMSAAAPITLYSAHVLDGKSTPQSGDNK